MEWTGTGMEKKRKEKERKGKKIKEKIAKILKMNDIKKRKWNTHSQLD